MNQQEINLAMRLYNAAISAGATHNNAVQLVGSAYQESSFNPALTGSDGGTSFGLMQVGSGLWNQMKSAGVANDPVGQLEFYINALQSHAPSTWDAMQSAATPQAAFNALYSNPDWRMGTAGLSDRFNYYNQLAELTQPAGAQGSDMFPVFTAQNLEHALPTTPTAGGVVGEGAQLPGGSEILPIWQEDPYIANVNTTQFEPPTLPSQSLTSALGEFMGGARPAPIQDLSAAVSAGETPFPEMAAPNQGGYSGSDTWLAGNPDPGGDLQPTAFDTYGAPQNIAPQEETGPTPVDTWTAFNPDPGADAQPTPADTWSRNNPDPGADAQPTPVDTWSAVDNNSGLDEWNNANQTYGEGMWFYNQNGDIVPIPDALSNYQPPELLGAPAETNRVGGSAPYDPLTQGSVGQPGGVPKVNSTIVQGGRVYAFDPTTGSYVLTTTSPTGIYAAGGPFSGGGSGGGGGGPQFSGGGGTSLGGFDLGGATGSHLNGLQASLGGMISAALGMSMPLLGGGPPDDPMGSRGGTP